MIMFLHGATTMGCLAIGLFFWKFWRESADRMFLFFALAFWILGVNYAVLGLVTIADETRAYVVALRLLAFGLILYGIFDKNRK